MTLVSHASAGGSNPIGANSALDSLTPETAASPRSPTRDAGLSLVGISVVAILWILLTFWFVHRFAVNTVLYDNWNDVRLISRANAGVLSLGDLWAQHGENRIFVPNLIVLGPRTPSDSTSLMRTTSVECCLSSPPASSSWPIDAAPLDPCSTTSRWSSLFSHSTREQ